MTGDLGVRIVTEIADREGVDPTGLTPPLQDVVDVDALEALFEPTPTTDRDCVGSVSFTYVGYEVTVAADGAITVENALDAPSAPEVGHETAVE
ncbi:HalOD1 output domain-containing protein [Halovivax cerinus]|uniref:HalOD1 output domain-containing protein n=1 Tax=Halovivax cerinus TaxID=1487865 RepID=A0ABD5NKX8_9EURY|nr:HalOD1 output domain-containing protein [Halovivax cerinus]